MAVPVEREPHPEPPYERCCFCRAQTIFWTNIARRTPGEQVACCEGCARTHRVSEVPTKDEWFKKERALEPQPERREPPSPWTFQGRSFTTR